MVVLLATERERERERKRLQLPFCRIYHRLSGNNKRLIRRGAYIHARIIYFSRATPEEWSGAGKRETTRGLRSAERLDAACTLFSVSRKRRIALRSSLLTRACDASVVSAKCTRGRIREPHGRVIKVGTLLTLLSPPPSRLPHGRSLYNSRLAEILLISLALPFSSLRLVSPRFSQPLPVCALSLCVEGGHPRAFPCMHTSCLVLLLAMHNPLIHLIAWNRRSRTYIAQETRSKRSLIIPRANICARCGSIAINRGWEIDVSDRRKGTRFSRFRETSITKRRCPRDYRIVIASSHKLVNSPRTRWPFSRTRDIDASSRNSAISKAISRLKLIWEI